jgi:ABC-type Fe3+-hydroxamate transport system substrate-binding protein
VGELNGNGGIFVWLLVSELLAEVQLDALYHTLPTVHNKRVYLNSAILEPHDQQPATLRKLYTVYF